MSSIPEDQQTIIAAVNKRSFFFRKDSIQKLKCTAMYPFQVAGIKLSKDAIIELLETNIMKARICTQKAVLNFYIVILRLLSSLFVLYNSIKDSKKDAPTHNQAQENNLKTSIKKEMGRKIRLLRQKRVDIVDDDDDAVDLSPSIENNKASSPTKRHQPNTYQSRLLAKLERIQKHKTRLNGKSLRLQLSSSTETEPEISKTGTIAGLTNVENTFATSRLTEKTFLLLKGDEECPDEKSKLQKYFLVLCVHIGLLIMYLQALVLCLLLNSAKIPSGLLFLITTITIIGYILFKVSFFHKFNGIPAKSSTNNNCFFNNAPENSSERQARSIRRKAPMLDIDSKTLSKVKLL